MKYTVAVCTLNEERNLPALLESLDGEFLEQIIILDGGSTDRTCEIAAKDPRVHLEVMTEGGLLVHRLRSLQLVKTELVAIIDGDDALSPGALDIARDELLEKGVDGIQLQMRARDPETWWEHGWDINSLLLYRKDATLEMLGRPCMTWTRYVQSVDPPTDQSLRGEAGNAEDNYIHSRQRMQYGQLRYVVSQASTNRDFPSRGKDNIVKWFRYGIGDAAGLTSLRRYLFVSYHQLFRCGISRAVRSIQYTKGRHIPFFLMFGGLRFVGSSYALLSRAFRRTRRG